MVKSVPVKEWIECRSCKNCDPCLMYVPKGSRKYFPKSLCLLKKKDMQKGNWVKAKWATELTP